MRWDQARPAARRRAADRAAAVSAVEAGGSVVDVARDIGAAPATVRRWVARAQGAQREGLTITSGLVDRQRSGRPSTVWSRPGAESAWDLWRGMYLRLEAPTAAGCWETVRRVGSTRGWQLPSVVTFCRRLRAEVPAAEVVRTREGRLAALSTYPFQRRTVDDLAPLDIVSGDGYRHNLFVIPPGGGSPFRPITWFWQDVRTRKMLAWRSGATESADLVRLAFHDLVTSCGVPGAVVQDNTRAASARWFGGASRRWRRDRDDTVPGILDLLGIRVIHTGVTHEANGKARGHGWAKPVERAFLDLGEEVDKHPAAAGAYTGRSPLAKPANYDASHAIDWETFAAVLDDGVAQHNARPGRQTEAASGRSLDATWEAEIATTPVRRLTRAQEALLLLAVESTQVQRSGLFRLAAGRASGLPNNDYWHPDLVARAGQRVVARFDPQQLHAGVEVFDADGRWLCRAECRMAVGFADQDAARTHNRAQRAHLRHLDRAAAAQTQIDELLDQHGVGLPAAATPARAPQQTVVRMAAPVPARPDTERTRALRARFDRGLARSS